MAITVFRYPGGVEYPEFWKNNVQGLTPTGSYTLSYDQALSKFPGLQYDAQFNTLKNSFNKPEVETSDTNWYLDDPTFQSLRQELNSLTGKIKANDPDQLGWLAYNYPESGLGTSEQRSDFSRSVQLGQELAKYYNNSLKPSSQSQPPTEATSLTNIKTIEPETQKNLEIVQQQAVAGNTDSKQFLDEYIAKEDNLIAQNIPGPTSSPSDKLRGQSSPIRYDKEMQQYVPMVPSGKLLDGVIDTMLKQAKGPRGETTIAQALPRGPRGMDRAPGTYHPSNIIPLITPGSRFSDKEGYMIQDPFRNSPQTGPGLSKQEEDFDPYQAQLASAAAKEYRQRGQVEDPFRSGAFG